MEIYREQTPEVFNRVIRTTPMSFADCIRLAYNCVKEKCAEVELADVNSQGLSQDYKTTMLSLEELFRRSPSEITNNFNEEL